MEERCLHAEALLAEERAQACEERQSVRDSMGYLVVAKEELELQVEQLVKQVVVGGASQPYPRGGERQSTLEMIASARKDMREMTEVLRDFQPLLGNLLRQVATQASELEEARAFR